jgi:hypothetical protein
MAALTSIIFIGQPHPNSGGIRPWAIVRFEEGSHPYFLFNPSKKNRRPRQLNLIPTADHMLDDLLLMIAYFICQVPALVDSLDQHCLPVLDEGRIDMNKDVPAELRFALYEGVKKLNDLPKISICLFANSWLASSISPIMHYAFECEASRPVFLYKYSAWSDSWEMSGKPDGPDVFIVYGN